MPLVRPDGQGLRSNDEGSIMVVERAVLSCRGKPLRAMLMMLVAVLGLAGCKSLPGADGEYATHDRGQNNRGSP